MATWVQNFCRGFGSVGQLQPSTGSRYTASPIIVIPEDQQASKRDLRIIAADLDDSIRTCLPQEADNVLMGRCQVKARKDQIEEEMQELLVEVKALEEKWRELHLAQYDPRQKLEAFVHG
jgi:hypothetical protein